MYNPDFLLGLNIESNNSKGKRKSRDKKRNNNSLTRRKNGLHVYRKSQDGIIKAD